MSMAGISWGFEKEREQLFRSPAHGTRPVPPRREFSCVFCWAYFSSGRGQTEARLAAVGIDLTGLDKGWL